MLHRLAHLLGLYRTRVRVYPDPRHLLERSARFLARAYPLLLDDAVRRQGR